MTIFKGLKYGYEDSTGVGEVHGILYENEFGNGIKDLRGGYENYTGIGMGDNIYESIYFIGCAVKNYNVFED